MRRLSTCAAEANPTNKRAMALLAEADRDSTRVRPDPTSAAAFPSRRIIKPGTWPIWWWYVAATLWTAAVTLLFFSLYGILHGWPWPWMALTFVVASANQIFLLHRHRKRNA